MSNKLAAAFAGGIILGMFGFIGSLFFYATAFPEEYKGFFILFAVVIGGAIISAALGAGIGALFASNHNPIYEGNNPRSHPHNHHSA